MTKIELKSLINYPLPSLIGMKADFVTEIESAQNSKDSSISFLLHSLENKPQLKIGEMFQVMVIGGSNFHSCIFTKKDERNHYSEVTKSSIPIFNTKEIFLDFILKNLQPDHNYLAINLAYPLEPVTRNGLLDCVLLKGTKEHEFKGLIGETVGEEIEKYIKETLDRDITVLVANDTIALVLAGIHEIKAPPISLVGGIVGTGVNFGFFYNETQVVNLESGGFNKFESSESGLIIDQNSSSPGEQLFEKEVAGGYLYKHYNIINKLYGLGLKEINSSDELSSLAITKEDNGRSLAQLLLERSASLIAVQIAGIYEFKKLAKLNFIIEGSLFWKGHNYSDLVKKYLGKLGVSESSINIIKIHRSYLLGIASLLD